MEVPNDKMKLDDEESSDYVRQKKSKSLLEKYDIPVSHLDYKYIETCQNSKEMERIVIILKSGEEGYYPDLLDKAIDRLRVLKPNSKYLRVDEPLVRSCQLNPDSREEFLNEFSEWCGDMQGMETDLKSSSIKFKSQAAQVKSRRLLPDIRNNTSFMTDSGEKRCERKTKRIAACDYESWDKYDPDTEILKMELEEEKNREAAAKAHAERESAIAKKKNKQAMVDLLSHSEKKLFADRQRIAGNESFRCGDYKIALVQYTESIELLQTAAAYNNRAATYLKLKQFNEASEDCNRVLALEPDNVKALIRKAEALQGLEEYVKAMEYYEQAIKINPNNTIAQNGAYECSRRINKSSKTIRMRIQDEDEQQSSCTIVELDDSYEKLNGQNESTVSSPKIVELNDTEEISEINRDNNDKRMNGDHMDINMNKMINTGREDQLNRNEANDNTQGPRNRTCLVPIASTSGFQGPTVIEVTIPEDMPLSSIDRSLSQSRCTTSTSEIDPQCSNMEDLTSADIETILIEEIEENVIIEEISIHDMEVADTLIEETKSPNDSSCDFTVYCDKPEEEILGIDQVDVNMEDKSSDFNEVESANTSNITEAEKHRVPLQEQDLRKQFKRDRKRARRVERNTNNFILSVISGQELGASRSKGKIEVAEKYRIKPKVNRVDASTVKKEESEEEKRTGDLRVRKILTEKQIQINERIRQNQLSSEESTFTPYEFLKTWESVKHDDDFSARAKILRAMVPATLKLVIGNKLDANMLTNMLECLKRHFIVKNDSTNANYLAQYLNTICQLPRFSVIAMFLNEVDKQNLKDIIDHIDKSEAKLCDEIRKYAS